MPVASINLMSILEDIAKEESRAIVIPPPSNIEWSDYEKELATVSDGRQSLNFKVSNFPKGIKVGSKCYLVHRGFVVGWMRVSGMSEKTFRCSTTGKTWSGKFIERSGPFHYRDEEIPMKGFQGFRYFSLADHLKKNSDA